MKRKKQRTGRKSVSDPKLVVQPKHVFLEKLINEAARQLDSPDPDLGAVSHIWGYRPSSEVVEPLKSAAKVATGGKRPKIPRGPDLESLPQLSKATRGVFKLWTIAGEPGIGKSSFVDQIIYDLLANPQTNVLKYDYENGPELTLARMFIAATARKRERELLKRLERLYFRESIRSLESDIAALGGRPTTVVVDSFQSLPRQVDDTRAGFDAWVIHFEKLAKEGHTVILISEKARSTYGDVSIAGFKETGELEYKSWVGIQLVGDVEDAFAPIKVHIVKNRAAAYKGRVVDLQRDRKAEFWFNEVSSRLGHGKDLD